MGEVYGSALEKRTTVGFSSDSDEVVGGVRASCLNALANDVGSGGDTAKGICTPWEYEQVSKLNLEGVEDAATTEGALGRDVEMVQEKLSGEQGASILNEVSLENYMKFWESISGGDDLTAAVLSVAVPSMVVAVLLGILHRKK